MPEPKARRRGCRGDAPANKQINKSLRRSQSVLKCPLQFYFIVIIVLCVEYSLATGGINLSLSIGHEIV
jgi:hypothetical protein